MNNLFLAKLSLKSPLFYIVVVLQLIIFFLQIPNAHAASLLYNSNGQLVRADNVFVNGIQYSVAFQDASCFQLIKGCRTGTFPFSLSNAFGVQQAAESLATQVFDGGTKFVKDPNLINGIEGVSRSQPSAYILTPFERGPVISEDTFLFYVWTQFNIYDENTVTFIAPPFGNEHARSLEDKPLTIFTDTGGIPNTVFAVWTKPIPEPSLLTLIGLGMSFLFIFRRKSRKYQATLNF